MGSSTPEGFGNYYAWGEIETKDTFTWETYRYCNGSNSTLTKYCNNANYGYEGFSDNLTTLEPEDDAAYMNCGVGWKIPTKDEMQELIDNCDAIETTHNGVNGRLFTGPNGNSIFIPAAGQMEGDYYFTCNNCYHYWSSSLKTEGCKSAWFFSSLRNITTGTLIDTIQTWTRDYGYSVRPVGVIQPTIHTNEATGNTRNSLTLNASIASDGGSTIITRGFYWGTTENDLPNYVASEQATSDFSATISNLSANTVYYYCAVATNIVGTSFGEVLSASTNPPTIPTIVTNAASIGAGLTATLNATIIDDGGSSIIAQGFYWGTSADNLVSNTESTGSEYIYSSIISGLSDHVTYYYCAYATNSIGTATGEILSFKACNCGGSYMITDIDGNQYGTIPIGEQCWMAENLRTTKFANGISIPLGDGSLPSTASRYHPNNNSSNVSTYGYLYNWTAAMNGASSSSTNPSNVQGVCPTGWHLPSDAEWVQLEDYLSSRSEYQCGDTATNIAKSLASTTGWSGSTTTCAVGNNPTNNNTTGFGALPAGHYGGGSYYTFGEQADFWSATEYDTGSVYGRCLYYNNASVNGCVLWKRTPVSVRCVRDN